MEKQPRAAQTAEHPQQHAHGDLGSKAIEDGIHRRRAHAAKGQPVGAREKAGDVQFDGGDHG